MVSDWQRIREGLGWVMKTKSLLVGLGVGILGFTSTLVAGVSEPYVADVGAGIKCTQQADISNRKALEQLPPPARETVERTIGNDPIRSVKTQTKSGTEVYLVKLDRRPGTEAYPTVLVAQDGTLVRESHMDNAATSMTQAPESGSDYNR